MRKPSLADALSLIGGLLLLFTQVPAARAQEPLPQVVANYALPDETIQRIPPILYQGSTYRVYYFADAPLDDLYGSTLFMNGRDTLQERGIRALLVTRNDRVVKDEATIRNILLLARTSYMLHRTFLPEEVTPVDQSLVDQVESLRKNPVFIVAFAEQNIRALFDTRKGQSAEALRGILTAQAGVTDRGVEFAEDVSGAVDNLGDAGDALDHAIELARYSNDPRMRTLYKRSKEVLQGWQKTTEQGRIFMDTPSGRIEFANGLDILGLGIEMIFLSDLQQERSDWLTVYREHFRSGNQAPDKDQLGAISIVQAEVKDDWTRRGSMALDFVREKAAELGTKWAAEQLAREWVEFSWKQQGTRTAGHLAAGAAVEVLLAFTLANLLYGMDDIFNNFTTADRADELRQRFRAGRVELQGRDWPEVPEQYDGDLAEAYRMAYMLEAFSGCQVYRSYADGVASSRAILALADLLSGGQWTEAIESLRSLADQYEVDAEYRLGHPDLIDRAVELVMARLEVMSPGRLGSSLVAWPSPLVLQAGQSGELAFELQNTGEVAWLPGPDFGLVCSGCERLGLPTFQPLANKIAVGQVGSWVIPVMAPSSPGLSWLQFQMAYREDPFGRTVYCLVVTAPQGQSGLDPGDLLREWLKQPSQRVRDWWEQYRRGLEERAQERLKREADRLARELVRSIEQQLCGAAMVVPAALIVGMTVAVRARRKRTRDHDRT